MTDDDTHEFDRRVVMEPQRIDEESTRAGLAIVHVTQTEYGDAISFENFHYAEDGEIVPTRAALAPYPDGLKAIVDLNDLYEEWKESKSTEEE
ncbi:hypothetical protein [Natrarchaeobaculum sulfurireducens]|uniref:Uncharacterized protein n=1 Tax=Natrarchaeobaculum sulfurireducens TaxID=2044521 RepID=A0A346PPS5_9EURY|nr:hypothetical protein [Natrarchaeobaculum sulfurireducens]AXR81520.1 hypothetical protein AArcMg_1507 [Natrarchaeobaculum sulfurireducens]